MDAGSAWVLLIVLGVPWVRWDHRGLVTVLSSHSMAVHLLISGVGER